MAPFWVAFFVSAVIALPVLKALIGLKSRQVVSQYVPEHAQKQGTPTMGGVIVVIGAMAGVVVLAANWPEMARNFASYLVVLIGYAAIGFIDDFVVPRLLTGKRGLGWKQKFGLEILIAAGAMALQPGINLATASAGVFIVLFFSNAYNFVDGMDALAGGVGIFLFSGLAFLDRGLSIVTPCALILIAALVPFLVLNAPPAKVFMGDVGALPIGAWVGLMVLQLGMAHRAHPVSLILISGVMAAELIPVPIQIASVKLFKRKVFMMTPIHHGFQKRGIPETRVVWAFILSQVVFCAAAISVQWCFFDGR